MSNRPKIIILRSNPVDPDPRVEKEAAALCSMADVLILARDRTGQSRPEETRPFGRVKRVLLPGADSPIVLTITLLIWWMYLFCYLLFHPFHIVHACDFDTYPPALLAARLKRRQVVYDIFDFYADTFAQNSTIHGLVSRIDKTLIGLADLVILVDRVRMAQIRPAKPKNVLYLYNIPNVEVTAAGAVDPNYFFYAGMLSRERMIEALLNVFARRPSWTLELAGWGPLERLIVDHCQAFSNIRFAGRIEYRKVIENEQKSLLILAFYDPAIANHSFASPNKLFEAITLEKPIISNVGTSMADFIQAHRIGELISYGDERQLEKALVLLQRDARRYHEYCRNCRNLARSEFNWPSMADRLVSSYRSLMR